MTNEQINAAIAKACGWVPDCDRGICWDQHGNAIITAPNYCTDLNAMHEAEKTLTCKQFEDYYLALYDVTQKTRWPVSATARERAEAFVRTLGKWEEVQG
jgi:hypothetical protein